MWSEIPWRLDENDHIWCYLENEKKEKHRELVIFTLAVPFCKLRLSTWLKFDNYAFIYACTVDSSLFSSFLTLYTIDISLHIKALEVVLRQDTYMDGKQISRRNVRLHFNLTTSLSLLLVLPCKNKERKYIYYTCIHYTVALFIAGYVRYYFVIILPLPRRLYFQWHLFFVIFQQEKKTTGLIIMKQDFTQPKSIKFGVITNHGLCTWILFQFC